MKILHYSDLEFLSGKVLIMVSTLFCNVNYKIYHAIALLICSTKAYSIEDVAIQTIKSDPMSGSHLLQLVIGLFIVVLCIVVLAWFAKKMNRFHSTSDDALKIIGAISMGARERVVLLQVGEEQLVLGVSPGRINTLHVLNTPVETITKDTNALVGNGFAAKLKNMIADANTTTVKKQNKS